jgi:hypothetical protein
MDGTRFARGRLAGTIKLIVSKPIVPLTSVPRAELSALLKTNEVISFCDDDGGGGGGGGGGVGLGFGLGAGGGGAGLVLPQDKPTKRITIRQYLKGLRTGLTISGNLVARKIGTIDLPKNTNKT